METHALNRRQLTLPVVFALACLVLTLITLRSFGQDLPLEPRPYTVSLPIDDATNLVSGSDVQIAGVRVGDVREVRRNATAAVVALDIDADHAPLRRGTSSVLRNKSLLGEAYLQLLPGDPGGPALAEGAALAPGRRAVPLDEFLGTFPRSTRRRVQRLFAGLARGLDGRAGDLNAALGHAPHLTAGLASMLRTVDEQRAQLQPLFANSTKVLDAIGRRDGKLRAAIVAGDQLFAATAARDRDLTDTVGELGPFLEQLRSTADTITGASGDLNRAVSSTAKVAPDVAPALAEIRKIAPEYLGLLRQLPGVLEAGNRGLPALRDILRPATPALRSMTATARELIPLMQLFGVNRRATYGVLSNVGNFTNGTYVAPGGKIVHYAGAAPSIWNESIGGWIKRLPTNRLNPYPKPDGLLDIGTDKVLKAYDCRNLKNPAYLPATGTGAPPCLLQGPWEFRGKRAYYPRLTLEPPASGTPGRP